MPAGLLKHTGGIAKGSTINRSSTANRNVVAWFLNLPGRRDAAKTWRDLTGAHRGLITGASWAGAFGRPGGYGSLNFTAANQYVDVSATLAEKLGGKTQASFSCWLYPRALVNNSYLLSAGLAFTLRFDGSPGRFTTQARASTGTISYEWGCTATTGQWQHIVSTVDIATDTARIYKNGVLAQESTATDLGTAFDPDADNNFYLGGTTNNFDGLLDDCRFHYDYAFTADQVWRLYEESRHGYHGQINHVRRVNLDTVAAAGATTGHHLLLLGVG